MMVSCSQVLWVVSMVNNTAGSMGAMQVLPGDCRAFFMTEHTWWHGWRHLTWHPWWHLAWHPWRHLAWHSRIHSRSSRVWHGHRWTSRWVLCVKCTKCPKHENHYITSTVPLYLHLTTKPSWGVVNSQVGKLWKTRKLVKFRVSFRRFSNNIHITNKTCGPWFLILTPGVPIGGWLAKLSNPSAGPPWGGAGYWAPPPGIGGPPYIGKPPGGGG